MDFKEIEEIVYNKVIWTFLILVAIGAILFCSYLIISSVLEARKECNNLYGEYKFKFTQGHFCNERVFVKYNSCLQGRECNLIWGFEDSIGKINLSEFIK